MSYNAAKGSVNLKVLLSINKLKLLIEDFSIAGAATMHM